METRGMPASGLPVDMQSLSCPCQFWSKYGSCIHTLYAMESRGITNILGRETLMNRGAKARRGAT
ncbi:hypothetical protein GQ600_25776 [Phytophthora cactorum]|nr:hypothetical protein GQ600_25776 [Phytophthora cactorum]